MIFKANLLSEKFYDYINFFAKKYSIARCKSETFLNISYQNTIYLTEIRKSMDPCRNVTKFFVS